jgi:hypothetical protein
MVVQDLVEARTPQEIYADEIDTLLRSVDRLEEQVVRRAIGLLTEARRRIVARLAELPGEKFEAYFLGTMQAEVEAQIDRYAREYQSYLTEESRTWWDMGREFVDRPLSTAGASSIIVQLPSLEPRFVDILTSYRASLISGIADHAVDRITTELQLGVLGGKTPFEIQRTVADILSTQRGPTGNYRSVAADAERIVRTELNRSFNMATVSRQEQFQDRVQQVFPEIKPRKRWLNAGDARVRPSHARQSLLDQRPLIDADFIVGGYPAKGPHDARLPASESINCRCRTVTDLDSIMSVLEEA